MGRPENKLTIIASSYFPETCAPAKRMHALARKLAERGFEVTVIAPLPNYPQGAVYDGWQKRWAQEAREDGVRVIRLTPLIVPKNRLFLRLVAEVLSAVYAALICLFMARSSLVFASSPAIFLGPAGMLSAKLTGARFVWDVRDLLWRYTQAVGESGLKRLAGDLIEALMVLTARAADLMTVTTESQGEYFIARCVPRDRTELMPNGISAAFFESMASAPVTSGSNGPFRVVYAGLIGYPQGLGTLISAAKLLAEEAIEFVIAGEGVERAGLEQRCQAEHIPNVRFAGYLSQKALAELYGSADLLYAQLRGEPVFASAQPSKVWEYLAAGRPLVYGGLGEGASAVERSGGGLAIAPDDPQTLAETISRLRDQPEERARMARDGKEFASAHLRQEVILARIIDRLERVLGRSPDRGESESLVPSGIQESPMP